MLQVVHPVTRVTTSVGLSGDNIIRTIDTRNTNGTSSSGIVIRRTSGLLPAPVGDSSELTSMDMKRLTHLTNGTTETDNKEGLVVSLDLWTILIDFIGYIGQTSYY